MARNLSTFLLTGRFYPYLHTLNKTGLLIEKVTPLPVNVKQYFTERMTSKACFFTQTKAKEQAVAMGNSLCMEANRTGRLSSASQPPSRLSKHEKKKNGNRGTDY